MNGIMKWFSKISFTQSIINGLREHSFEEHDDVLEYRAIKIIEAAQDALQLQHADNNVINQKSLKKLNKQIEEFEDTSRIGVYQHISTLLSFTLTFVDDLEQYITNHERLRALGVLTKRLNWIISHQDVDSKLDKPECYDKAVEFFNLWEKILI